MTDHKVIAWKMDEQNTSIVSIQSLQMWNNINSSGNYQRNINQQNSMRLTTSTNINRES